MTTVDPATIRWDAETDAVVVGFGAAGACAALEATGLHVTVLDRYLGGGATALSGGVVYAGGGTPAQRAAGVTDTPEAMREYLRREVGDAVDEETLARFCAGSVADLEWLTGHGVRFEGSLCPDKTSYPTNQHYLYYSGSERSGWATAGAEHPPAPRGHRVKGRTMSGKALARTLMAAAERAGVTVRRQTTAEALLLDDSGRVVGVRARTMATAPAAARLAHRLLARAAAKPYLYYPRLGRALYRSADRLAAAHARPITLRARAVVLAAGGFVANREQFRAEAPRYRGGLALGTPGDDGAGLRLGTAAGGATGRLDRATAWRFLSPPTALLGGLLVDRSGRRLIDESRYGAAVGEAILDSPDRRAWLLVDAAVVRRSWRQLRRQTLWFQRMQALALLTRDRVSAPTVEQVAARAGVDAAGLAATVAEYRERRAQGLPDALGKPADVAVDLRTPPYSLIDVSIRRRLAYPCPMLTLGGLVVDERTGQVLRDDRTPVEGLWAAGRTAIGLCSTAYTSGLSLADCVFSGRRAGRALTAAIAERSTRA